MELYVQNREITWYHAFVQIDAHHAFAPGRAVAKLERPAILTYARARK